MSERGDRNIHTGTENSRKRPTSRAPQTTCSRCSRSGTTAVLVSILANASCVSGVFENREHCVGKCDGSHVWGFVGGGWGILRKHRLFCLACAKQAYLCFSRCPSLR